MSTKPRGESRGRAFTTDAAPPHQKQHDPNVAEHTAQPLAEHTTLPAVMVSTQPLAVNDYGEDAGAGMENVSQSEMLIPFVRIIQPTAGVLKEASPNYDEHAKQGMLFLTASGVLVDRKIGVGFIPAFRDSSYTEWVSLDDGGGFRGTWPHDDPRVEALLNAQGAFKALKTDAGTELVETYTIYGVVVPRDATGKWLTQEATPGVIAFTSTQIKKYRTLITRLQALIGSPKPRYPMFAWRWNVSTVPEKNKKGDYYGWYFALDGETADGARLTPVDPLYQLAKEVHQLVSGGAARADFAASEVGSEETGSTARSGGGQTIDQTGNTEEEIPF